MYVNPVAMGVLLTLFVQETLVIAAAIVFTFKK